MPRLHWVEAQGNYRKAVTHLVNWLYLQSVVRAVVPGHRGWVIGSLLYGRGKIWALVIH